MCTNVKLQGLVGHLKKNNTKIYIHQHFHYVFEEFFPFFQVAVAVLSCCSEGKFKKEPEKGREVKYTHFLLKYTIMPQTE